jgi:hypothetical protein
MTLPSDAASQRTSSCSGTSSGRTAGPAITPDDIVVALRTRGAPRAFPIRIGRRVHISWNAQLLYASMLPSGDQFGSVLRCGADEVVKRATPNV